MKSTSFKILGKEGNRKYYGSDYYEVCIANESYGLVVQVKPLGSEYPKIYSRTINGNIVFEAETISYGLLGIGGIEVLRDIYTTVLKSMKGLENLVERHKSTMK